MNLVRSQWKIVERPVKTKDGKDAVAFVALLVVGDKVVSANLIDVKLVSKIKGNEPLKLCVACKTENTAPISKIKINKIVSPYFDTFKYLVNQSPRAPSF